MPRGRPHGPESLDPARRLIFLSIASSDMGQCAEACDFALAEAKNGLAQSTRYLCFSDLAVLRYCRPFLASRVIEKPRTNAALTEAYIPRDACEHAADVHAMVVRMRGGIIGHSDIRNRNIRLKHVRAGEWSPSSMRAMAIAVHQRMLAELNGTAAQMFPMLEVGAVVELATGNPDYIRLLQSR